MNVVFDFNYWEKLFSFVDIVNVSIDIVLIVEQVECFQCDYFGGSWLGDICQCRL